jgi:ABC-type uncharacterized transport system permease subunit
MPRRDESLDHDLTQFLQNILVASPLVAGLETMPWTRTIMLIAPLTGWLTKRLGRRAVVLAGMLAMASARGSWTALSWQPWIPSYT